MCHFLAWNSMKTTLASVVVASPHVYNRHAGVFREFLDGRVHMKKTYEGFLKSAQLFTIISK